HAEAAADVEMLDRRAVGGELAREIDERARGVRQRFHARDLRADVRVQADDLDVGEGAGPRAQGTHVADRDAELVDLQAGRDVRMRLRVHVGVDADRDPRAYVPLARQLIDAPDLPFRFDIDRADAEIDRVDELGIRLADAREDNLRRDEAGAHRDVDLAGRVRIGMAAEAPEQARDRERRVRLERI